MCSVYVHYTPINFFFFYVDIYIHSVYIVHPARLMIHCKEEECFFTTVNQKHPSLTLFFWEFVFGSLSSATGVIQSCTQSSNKDIQKECDPNRMVLMYVHRRGRYFWGFIALEYLIRGYGKMSWFLNNNNKVKEAEPPLGWFLPSLFDCGKYTIRLYGSISKKAQRRVSSFFSINSTL